MFDSANKPEFPWNFLDDPTGDAGELAAIWLFRQLEARAYRDYLTFGRGLLIGPYLSDEYENTITAEEAVERHRQGLPVGLGVLSLPARSSNFAEIVSSGGLQRSVVTALGKYDPSTECVVLLMHNDRAVAVRIIGTGDESGIDAPKAAWQREVLESHAPTGRPN